MSPNEMGFQDMVTILVAFYPAIAIFQDSKTKTGKVSWLWSVAAVIYGSFMFKLIGEAPSHFTGADYGYYLGSWAGAWALFYAPYSGYIKRRKKLRSVMSVPQKEANQELLSSVNLDSEDRILCSDGSCTGIIGPDGCCNECKKRYTP